MDTKACKSFQPVVSMCNPFPFPFPSPLLPALSVADIFPESPVCLPAAAVPLNMEEIACYHTSNGIPGLGKVVGM